MFLHNFKVLPAPKSINFFFFKIEKNHLVNKSYNQIIK